MSRVLRKDDTQSEGLDNMDELTEQLVITEGTITAGNQTQSKQDFTGTSGQDLKPDNRDLERGEVAEIVAVEFTGGKMEFGQDDGVGTTPGSAWAEIQAVTDGYESEDAISNNVEDGSGNTGELKTTSRTYTNYLWGTATACGSAFNDTVNGTGGGGYAGNFNPFVLNYRDQFGIGPLLWWDEDEPYFQHQTQITTRANSNLVLHYKAFTKYYFDFHELDDEPRRIEDILG